MKPRYTKYSNTVKSRIHKQLGLPPRNSNTSDALTPNQTFHELQPTPLVHIKLLHRQPRCDVAHGSEYLMVVAYELDHNGYWYPHHTVTACDYGQLKTALSQLAATADRLVIEGSEHFSQLARELGFSLLNGEWGRV